MNTSQHRFAKHQYFWFKYNILFLQHSSDLFVLQIVKLYYEILPASANTLPLSSPSYRLSTFPKNKTFDSGVW